MKLYTMPDKCHDEGCTQPVGSRWACDICPNWEKMNAEKGPFKQLRILSVHKEATAKGVDQ
jgi:hypothetical protein